MLCHRQKQVIGAYIVLIDGLFHKAQAKKLRVEIVITFRIRGYRRQVMNALKLHLTLSDFTFSEPTLWRYSPLNKSFSHLHENKLRFAGHPFGVLGRKPVSNHRNFQCPIYPNLSN